MDFDRSLDVAAGREVRLSPLVSRVLAPNPGPFTFKGTGVYFIGSGENLTVIDPGPDLPDHVAALKAAIGSRKVSHILVTHTHRDHSPAAAMLKDWSGGRTYGSPLATAMTFDEGMVDEAHDHDFVPDVRVEDGMTIEGDGFTLQAVATPGHTANHVCYAVLEEKALFSGDHVMGWSTSVIAPPDGHMGQYLASLEKLRARDDRVFYPTHGSPITDPRDRLSKLIAHRRLRETQVVESLGAGTRDIAALVDSLYPGIVPALRGAASQQVKAHLEHLMELGAVTRTAGSYSLK